MTDDAEMKTRKLQKVGGSTYTVSIPKRWALEHGLEAGDRIHLYTHRDGSLVVRSARKDGGDLTATSVEVERTSPEAVEQALKATYAAGLEEIELVAAGAFSPGQRRAAGSLAKTLVGTQVVTVSEDRIAVRNALDPSNVSIQQSLIQLQFVALSMHRTATAAVSAGAADRVTAREGEADRLCEMVTRHFNRSLTNFEELNRLGVGRRKLFERYLTARQLRRVARHAIEIARVAERIDDAVCDETAADIESVADAVREVVEVATDAVLDGETTTAHEALERHEPTVESIETIDRALFERAPDDAYYLSRVVDSLARTAESGEAIARIAVQSAVRDEK